MYILLFDKANVGEKKLWIQPTFSLLKKLALCHILPMVEGLDKYTHIHVNKHCIICWQISYFLNVDYMTNMKTNMSGLYEQKKSVCSIFFEWPEVIN